MECKGSRKPPAKRVRARPGTRRGVCIVCGKKVDLYSNGCVRKHTKEHVERSEEDGV